MGKTVRITRRYPQTDAQRTAYNEYQKRYRREHPEAVKRWQDAYIMRKAARLAAEQSTARGGDLDAGA